MFETVERLAAPEFETGRLSSTGETIAVVPAAP